MKKDILMKEDGQILIVALVLLVLLTFMGISATTITDIELQIAGNELTSRANFYRAESAAMENVQVLTNFSGTSIIEPTNFPKWLHLESNLLVPNNITDPSNWTPLNLQVSVTNDHDENYMTIFEGVVPGDSLDTTRSRVYSYRVVGRGSKNNGFAFVEMGFRRPF